MKKTIIAVLAIMLALPAVSYAKGGHYKGGHGSSHKQGHYKNSKTNNHYKKRKH